MVMNTSTHNITSIPRIVDIVGPCRCVPRAGSIIYDNCKSYSLAVHSLDERLLMQETLNGVKSLKS